MKSLFVLISNVLASLFFVWVFTVWSDTFVSHYYPSVAVMERPSDLTYPQVADALEDLARQRHSLIALQHWDLGSDGISKPTYTVFGEGELPDGLKEKEIKDEEEINLAVNYFIFSGQLRVGELKDALSQLGLTKSHIHSPSFLSTLSVVFGRGFPFMGLIVFLLTFGAMTVIGHIKVLRTVGILLISGERHWKIFLGHVQSDSLMLALGCLVGLVVAALTGSLLHFTWLPFYMTVMGLLAYNLLLLILSLLLALLFAIAMKRISLMQVIKGKLPVRGMMSVMLIGQVLAVLMVAFGLHRSVIYFQGMQQQEMGRLAWEKEQSLISLSMNRDSFERESVGEAGARSSNWYSFVNQAIKEDVAILSEHYLGLRNIAALTTKGHMEASYVWEDYSPEGNALYVTPQYLKRQQVEVSPEIAEKANNLSLGEFILLLPEKLKHDEANYRALFEKHVTRQTAMREATIEQPMTATIAYLDNNKDRFIYNASPMTYHQFLRDPIIVVVTPEAMGEHSYDFWTNVLQTSLYIDDLKTAQKLLQTHDLVKFVGELGSPYQTYLTLLDNLKRESLTMFLGSLLGVATSLLMFNTMNLLYFAEFRRDIFIKRVAGFSFFSLHRSYLLAQCTVFLLGFLASSMMISNVWVGAIVFWVFMLNAMLLLAAQSRKENAMSMIMLKGA
ncbi:DUF1430 domain-containing protein [Streptococcus plurextorum]|uniref:DUF1430 domain-containing protein n=1 Tax=Streptococcus plurextorum TaxID=456876 RepID=UPI00042953F4|nr:DUF1430 domain-containing protein [Streptococcus plurextorum]